MLADVSVGVVGVAPSLSLVSAEGEFGVALAAGWALNAVRI